MGLSTDLFDYPLPPELIAQTPAERRDESRLMVVSRSGRSCVHARFSDLPSFLSAGDRLFRNNATVIPARLHGRRLSGGKVECFLLSPAGGPDVWRCLLRPARKLPPASRFRIGPDDAGSFEGEVIERRQEGEALVRFHVPAGASLLGLAERAGEVPLPPYIARADSADPRRSEDRERYQTVYADPAKPVAVAAPTAGLHFTPALLDRLAAAGIAASNLTLQVGLGTFRPIATDTVEAHPIHREAYEIPPETQRHLFPPQPGRRIAVGTTAVRTIEDFLEKRSQPQAEPFCGESQLYVYPPRRFQGVDALITNFHLPRSTLLCLVAAFLTPGSESGIAWLRELYAEAVGRRYRFLSYGDAMLIL